MLNLKEKLNPQLKASWVDALTNGTYVQAKDVMYKTTVNDVHEMCCLGVLEHICGSTIDELRIAEDNMPEGMLDRKSPESVLSQKVELTRINNLSIYRGSLEGYLAHMNDGGKSFEEIANFIKENL